MSSASGWWAEARRQLGVLPHVRQTIVDERLDIAKDLYKRDLLCHYGCVNAIEFSKDGSLLASGGDDQRVVLWRVGQTLLQRGEPEPMLQSHSSNIFCLAITPDNSRIYSGGNDDRVLVHDSETKLVVDVLPHQKAVYGIALNPSDDHILATAGNDGRLLVFDTRQSTEEIMVVSRSRRAFHAVSFHPLQCDLIVAANARHGATLWDLRKPKHAVIKYGDGCSMIQNCMSVRFNGTGDRILTLRRRLPPALYAVDSVNPIAIFYHTDYYNSCTMKSCTFAGDRDQFVLSGSDDFNLYMWKVPDTNQMTWVSQQLVLYGHRSIVNQVRYNPQYCVIASSGVEKIIKLWSPLPIASSKGALLEETSGPAHPRDVYSHNDYVSLVHHSGQYISHNYADRSTSEDPRMMAFFDSLVQREIECWSADETDSSSDDRILASLVSNNYTTRRATQQITLPETPKNTDSSDSDQMLIHFLRKKIPNGIRNQRSQNRIARLIATRQSKLVQLAKKRISPRCNKVQLASLSSLMAPSSSKRMRATRPLSARRGLRRGDLSPPLPLPQSRLNDVTDSPHSDSDPDSDNLPSPRSHNRHISKMTRPNRGRMNMTRNFKRKNRPYNYSHMKSHSSKNDHGYSNGINSNIRNESTYNDDHLAIPSTSTGIRGHPGVTLFRIAEVDSEDDQSTGSCPKSPQAHHSTDTRELPLVNILPIPINGSRDNVNPSFRMNNPWPSNNADRLSSNNRSVEETNQIDLETWNMSANYVTMLDRLRSETNSEVESSCSTGDEVVTPNRQRAVANLETPDSSVHTGPSTSSGSRGGKSRFKTRHRSNNDVSDESDWTGRKSRDKLKRAYRNYRKHIGESDST